MSLHARLLWLCFATAALCFVALAILSNGLQPDGLLIFDSRVLGYSEPEARSYLRALAQWPEARDLYLTTFRQLDTVFPLLLGVSLLGGLWVNSARWAMPLRAAALALPCAYVAFDLAENHFIAHLITTGEAVFQAAIDRASLATQSKWAALAASLILLGVAWFGARPKEHAR